ncbi:MAG: dihydropteroate synthase [Anaerolineales bacterium]|jgi:5-methyltetrahydrofolate--homocysteine methyltransferase
MSENLTTIISSKDKSVEINRSNPTVIIGERINPTGRKALLAELKEGKFDIVKRDAVAQVEAGAKIIDVNAGVPGADEEPLLRDMMQAVMEVTDAPLCIDTADNRALEGALSIYEGKALVNSVNGEEARLESVLPLVKEYDASVIALCMDDDGIPPTAQDRFQVAAKMIERAGKLGIAPERLIIDPLALTMGSDHKAGKIAIDTIRMVVAEFGVNITMGASNISFGLPDRPTINATFISMSILAGLTCPITNPLEGEVSLAVKAADLVMGRDEFGMNWIKNYRARTKES